MHKHPYTKAKAGAIVFGIAASACAMYLLLEDVAAGGAFTSDHLVSIVVLALAIGASHYAAAAMAAGKWFRAAGFAVIAVAASALVMIGTAGRNADLQASKGRVIANGAAELADATAELATARRNVEAATTRMVVACKGGNGGDCKGARFVLDTFQTVADVKQFAVERVTPKRETPGKAAAFAGLLGTLGMVQDAKNAERVLGVVLPFVGALVLEGAAGMFFSTAFPVAAPPVASNSNAPANDAEPADAIEPEPKPRKRKPAPVKKAAPTNVVAADVLEFLRANRREITNEDLAKALGYHPGSVCRARKQLGGKVRARREGRKVYASVA